MGCDCLSFLAPANPAAARSATSQEGVQWHLYGDARWRESAVWVEFVGYFGPVGILTLLAEIPVNESDPFEWAASNLPIQHLFPSERSEMAIQQRAEMLRRESASSERVPGPIDPTPRFVQSYCVYRDPADVRLVAWYSDLLNAAGIPIPKYRTANVPPEEVNFCRFGLHGLFCLNRASREGLTFIANSQFTTYEPAYLSPNQVPPYWVSFHPSRVLRTRPALRALPTPTLRDGTMCLADFENVTNTRRIELNTHMLAFERTTRPQVDINVDGNSSVGAFLHRANGGAIYLLPDPLVNEFHQTDCDEIRMSDLRLPFPIIFLKFTPPEPLSLADGAFVDGCYIAKQEDEYLITLTSCWQGVDYMRSLSVACIDPTFSLHLPAPEFDLKQPGKDIDISLSAAVERGIEAFMAENAPPAEDLSRTIERPDGTAVYAQDVRAKSRQRRMKIFLSQEPVFRT